MKLDKFDPIKAGIEKLKPYLNLKVEGVDKSAYQVVRTARLDVKNKRVTVEKIRKDLVAPALEMQKKVNDEAKSITQELKKIETYLQGQEQKYLEEKEKIRLEEERKKQEEKRKRHEFIRERVNRMLRAGMAFNGETYTYEEYRIESTEVEDMPKEAFDHIIEQVRKDVKERNKQEEVYEEKPVSEKPKKVKSPKKKPEKKTVTFDINEFIFLLQERIVKIDEVEYVSLDDLIEIFKNL